jgi:hypothetical protein
MRELMRPQGNWHPYERLSDRQAARCRRTPPRD